LRIIKLIKSCWWFLCDGKLLHLQTHFFNY